MIRILKGQDAMSIFEKMSAHVVASMQRDNVSVEGCNDAASYLASALERAAAANGGMRAVAEALGFEPDNHHNAARCPYCSPPQPLTRLVERIRGSTNRLSWKERSYD